jgi:hypothetical protein
MALDSFIPEIWSATLIRSLRNELVYSQAGVINHDYEGEFSRMGDTVRVASIGSVSVSDYVRNTDIAAPEELKDASAVILIDQQKYFHFGIDDVDKAQSFVDPMNVAMDEAAFSLMEVADSYVATKMLAGASAANAIGTDGAPIAITSANAYDYLVDLGVKMSIARTPRGGRWIIVPPGFVGYLLKDSRFLNATETGNTIRSNGLVGRVAGFDIIESNTVPVVGGNKYKIIAGTSAAFTFAQQVRKVEAYRPERRFGDAVKGLHVYGGKVIRPEALAVLTVTL